MKLIRWPFLLAGGACFLLARLVSHSSVETPAVVSPAKAHASVRTASPVLAPAEPMADLGLHTQKPVSRASALFTMKDWMPPTPTPVPIVRPAITETPRAPQVPFRYMGHLRIDSEKNLVFLVNGDTLHTVKVGDVLDERYKIKKIEGNVMTLVYLPLNQTQMLTLGEME